MSYLLWLCAPDSKQMEFELCLTSLALDQIVKQYMWEERFLQAEYRIYVTFDAFLYRGIFNLL